jgi:hypothetical protein
MSDHVPVDQSTVVGYVVLDRRSTHWSPDGILRKPNNGFAYKTPEAAAQHGGYGRLADPDSFMLMQVNLAYTEVPWPEV